MFNRFKVLGSSLLIVSLLAACGNGDQADSNGPAGEEVEVGEEQLVDTGEPITIASWLTVQRDLDEQVVEAYMAENPDAPEIEFTYVGDNQTDNYEQQVDLMLLGGEDVDIVMASDYASHAQRASSGSYLPLDMFFEDEGIDPQEEYVSSLVPVTNDEIYAIPGDGKAWVVFINKEKLEEAGLEPPAFDWTWDDFAEYAEALTTEDTYGAYFHNWHHFNYLNMLSLKQGASILKEDGSLVFDDPKFKEFLEFRKGLEESGSLLPYQTIVATQSTYRDRFFNEEIAMLPMGSFLIQELDDTTSFPHDFTTTFAMMPRDADAPAGRTYSEAHYYSIAAHSDNPKGAYDFLRYYTTEGSKIVGANLPTYEVEDKMEFVEAMVDDESYVDFEQLGKILNHEDWEDNADTDAPPYALQLQDLMIEEAEKYYLGDADLDEVIDNMMRRGQDIIDRNE